MTPLDELVVLSLQEPGPRDARLLEYLPATAPAVVEDEALLDATEDDVAQA